MTMSWRRRLLVVGAALFTLVPLGPASAAKGPPTGCPTMPVPRILGTDGGDLLIGTPRRGLDGGQPRARRAGGRRGGGPGGGRPPPRARRAPPRSQGPAAPTWPAG